MSQILNVALFKEDQDTEMLPHGIFGQTPMVEKTLCEPWSCVVLGKRKETHHHWTVTWRLANENIDQVHHLKDDKEQVPFNDFSNDIDKATERAIVVCCFQQDHLVELKNKGPSKNDQ